MKVEEFNKLTSEIDVYRTQATEDLKKIKCFNQLSYIFKNNTIERLEKFLYTVYHGNLQTERKSKEIPETKQNKHSWNHPAKIGVGLFLGTMHSYRTTIEYFKDIAYLFKLNDDYLPLIINEEKRKVIGEFIDWKNKYDQAFSKLGFSSNKELFYDIDPCGLIIQEPVNFFTVDNKHFSVSYDPFKIPKIELCIHYHEIADKDYRQDRKIKLNLFIQTNKNLLASAFRLNEIISENYILNPVEKYSFYRNGTNKWIENPFTFTTLSDVMNLPGITDTIKEIYNTMKRFEELAHKLLEKHARLMLIKGKF